MRVTRESLGMASFSSCSRLVTISGPRIVFPVMFPPGRPRLATSPVLRGSPILERDALTFHVSEVAQHLQQWVPEGRVIEETDPRNLRPLLRLGSDWHGEEVNREN